VSAWCAGEQREAQIQANHKTQCKIGRSYSLGKEDVGSRRAVGEEGRLLRSATACASW